MSDTITISFLDKAQRRAFIQLPWAAGKSLRHYLRVPALRKYGLLHVAKRSRIMNQERKKRRLRSPLVSGETIFLEPAGRAMS